MGSSASAGARLAAAILAASFLAAPNEPDAGRVEPSLAWVGAHGRPLFGDEPLLVHCPEEPAVAADASAQRFRFEIEAPGRRPRLRLSICARPPGGGRCVDERRVDLFEGPAGRLVTRWLVVVVDPEDAISPVLREDAIQAELGGAIEARLRRGGERAKVFLRRVGGAGERDDPRTVLALPLSVKVLRAVPGGPPVVGGDEEGAARVAEHQLRIAAEVLGRCHIAVLLNGRVEIADPPGPSLIVIGGEMGLPSAGGVVRMTVDGARLGPWRIGAGYTPEETARLLARHLGDAGLVGEVEVAGRNANDAFASADVLVRRRDRTLAVVGAWDGAPLSTDGRQSMTVGRVDLSDGLDTYGPNRIAGGTTEERALIRGLRAFGEDGPMVVIVNRMADQSRQAESFVAALGSALADTVVLDSRAVARGRQVNALAHELGHVLLDDAGHPDERPDDRPWLLMHSGASAAVDGPRFITPGQCERMRRYLGLIERGSDGVSSPSGT